MRVLLVEDNLLDARMVLYWLSNAPQIFAPAAIETTHAGTLAQAVNLLGSSHFDVVVLDLSLPDGDGIECYQRIRAAASMVPVVVLSGRGDEALALHIVRQGAQDYLVKGQIVAGQLARSVKYAVERQRLETRLWRMTRAMRVLSECNHALVHAEDEPTFLAGVCASVADTGGYRLAWVGLIDAHERLLWPVIAAGVGVEYLSRIRATWDEEGDGLGPAGAAVRSRAPHVMQLESGHESVGWQAIAVECGFRSAIILPLVDAEVVLGVLAVYSTEPNAFEREATSLMTELALDLGLGIGMLRRRREPDSAVEIDRTAESRYRRLTEGSPAAIFQLDAAAQCTFVNRRWCEMTGLKSEDAMGDGWVRMLPPEDRDGVVRTWRDAVEGQGPAEVETRFYRADGSVGWLLVQMKAMRRPCGTLEGYVGVATDMTSRKRRELEIEGINRDLEARLRAPTV